MVDLGIDWRTVAMGQDVDWIYGTQWRALVDMIIDPRVRHTGGSGWLGI
jgi:hypothetical protein